MHHRLFVAAAVALLPAVLFHATPAGAQTARTYKFTCSVERTLTDTTFGSLQRSVVCPVVATFSSTRVVAGTRERQLRYVSAACLIPTGATKCEGTFLQPAQADLRILAVTTSRSLLNEAETLSGALPLSNSFPEVRTTFAGYEVRHAYAFPQVGNRFHNANSPCDVNGDGSVSPLDVLALVNFHNANGNNRINLSSFQPQPGSPQFPDPTNDWFSDDNDYRAVVGCLNSR
jgi:hypothetical protein